MSQPQPQGRSCPVCFQRGSACHRGENSIEQLADMLAARGFREYPPSRLQPGITRDWFKIITGEPCRSNDKLQLRVSLVQFTDRGETHSSVTVEIVGADSTDQWWNLQAYAMPLDGLGQLDNVIARLTRAWNSLHQELS